MSSNNPLNTKEIDHLSSNYTFSNSKRENSFIRNKLSSEFINHEPQVSEAKKSQLYINILTGGISASVSRTVICPLERVEILRQLDVDHYRSLSVNKALMQLYNNQGFYGLYKGNTAALSRIFPFSSIEFFSMEFYKNKFIRGDENTSHVGSKKYIFLCSVLTAFNAITFTYPLDVVRTRIAANITDKCISETRFLRTLILLFKTQGIKGLYKGYYLSFIGSMPFIAIKQSVYEILKMKYKSNNKKYQSMINFVNGSLASLIGTSILYPTYMIKRVLQANGK